MMSNVMLSNSGDDQHFCYVSVLMGKVFSPSPLSLMLFIVPCIRLKKVIFTANLLGNFIMNVEFSQMLLIW